MAANHRTHNDVDFSRDETGLTATLKFPEKTKATFTIQKTGRWNYFTVSTDSGKVPKELSGLFTSLPEAIDRVKSYHERVKVSRGVEVEEKAVRRRKAMANDPVGNAESGEQSNSGADH